MAGGTPEVGLGLLATRYRLDEVIGSGGMATVYRAQDVRLGRDVAVKVFRATSEDTGRREAELSVLAGLNHHGLANILDAGFGIDPTGASHRFLVTELVVGTDLHERLRGEPFKPRALAEIGYDLAEALDYVHHRGVIHRDIKPSNILLVDYGLTAVRARAKLADFGIALLNGQARLTTDGTTTGTAAYLSPEQVRGTDVTPATDIYSLGLVLLECFTRSVEFGGTQVESAIARISRDPRIPESIPPEWATVLAAMTAQDPAARPDGVELIHAMRQLAFIDDRQHRTPDVP